MCIDSQGPAGAKPVGLRSLKELRRDFQQRQIGPAVAKLTGFRSLKELSQNFQQRQIGAKRGFRSLEDLSRDFQQRQAMTKRGFRSLDQLNRAFQQRQMFANRTFRSLDQLSQEFQRLQTANVLDSEVQDWGCSKNGMVNSLHLLLGPAGTVQCIEIHIVQPPPAKCRKAQGNASACYNRAELLGIFGALHAAGRRALAMPSPVIRTVHLPRTIMNVRRTPRVNLHEQDRNLDDERSIAKMETRLSWESGANAKNVETFGEHEGSWTFDDFVAANAKLPLCHAPVKGEPDNSTAASDGTASEHGSLA